jgi:hypothetical protein
MIDRLVGPNEFMFWGIVILVSGYLICKIFYRGTK